MLSEGEFSGIHMLYAELRIPRQGCLCITERAHISSLGSFSPFAGIFRIKFSESSDLRTHPINDIFTLSLGEDCDGTETARSPWTTGIPDRIGLHEHRHRRCVHQQREKRQQGD
jgi:hypothetical protein